MDKNKNTHVQDDGDALIDRIGDGINMVIDNVSGIDVVGDVVEIAFETVAGGIKHLVEEKIKDTE